jgi:hypothetical protein
MPIFIQRLPGQIRQKNLLKNSPSNGGCDSQPLTEYLFTPPLSLSLSTLKAKNDPLNSVIQRWKHENSESITSKPFQPFQSIAEKPNNIHTGDLINSFVE